MILAFLAGAGVLGLGIMIGGALVKGTYQDVLKNGTDE